MGKAIREKIRLNSTGENQKGKKTGYFKTTTINRRTRQAKGLQGKFKTRCFDPRAYNKETGKCGMHVEFVEGKIK